MPMSRSWVEPEIVDLEGEDYDIAKLILIVSMASYQFDESLVKPELRDDQERLIRVLAFAAMSAARRLANHAGRHLNAERDRNTEVKGTHCVEA